MNILIQDQIKLKFKNGAVCPHCGSKEINKFGFFKGKQRYRCKECKRTFNLYTNTLLSWSHYKEKWESFIDTMGKDLSLRQAGQQVGVSYVTLFYWRHKIMTILNEENSEKLHGILELSQMKLKYIDKYRRGTEEKEYDEDEEQDMKIAENIFFAFLYQRDNRLNSYIYKINNGVRPFIDDVYDNIDEKSMVCLNSNYPLRFPLLYKKIKVADKKNYKRAGYFNADSVRKYLSQFKCWIRMFRGVSSKNLIKYAAFFRSHKIFNNMEYIIMSSLRDHENIANQYAVRGELGF